jgi:predicted amidophosphoribosyltransferase
MLKFEGRSRIASLFADLAAGSVDGNRERLPVVPVPPRPGRSAPDAVEHVARRLAQRHGRRVSRLLVRTGGVPQKSLSLEERRKNLHGMIQIAPSMRTRALPPRVLLLDDVFTTGATIDECARTLREAGCSQIYALTLAIEE